MSNTPQVSVVIPTHNRPELLQRAVNSVRAQTFQDFEIIVIDDGTRIRAEDVVRSFSDSRIRYLKNETGLGAPASRNRGIREAQTELIAFLDDDDEWLPEKLTVQLGPFIGTDESVGFSVTGAFTENEKTRGVNVVEEGINDFSNTALTRFKGFLTSTLIVKRSVFDTVGFFDETLPSHQEAELLVRITRVYKGVGVNQPLTVMNMFEHEHIGGDITRRIRGREMVLEKHKDLFSQHPLKLAKHYFWLGLWYRDSGNANRARELFWKAFRLSKSPRYMFHALVVSFR